MNFIFPGITWLKAFLMSLHSMWMIIIALLWLGHVNYMDGFEFMNDYFNMRSFFKEYVFKDSITVDDVDKMLFINTSRNNELLPFDNDNTINTVITDRTVLADKLKILNENQDKVKFVICDVFFESPSDNATADSLLQKEIRKLTEAKKFAMPGFYNDVEKEMIVPVFEGTTGLSQYRSSFLNIQFLKYSLILYKDMPQIPLMAWEAMTNKKMQRKELGFINYYTHDGKWVLNTFIPEFRYAQSDLIEGLNYFQLGLFEDYLLNEDQIVIIGDFEGSNDIHHSMAGLISGPMILANIVASLMNNDHVISMWYIILLFVVFFYVSYHSLCYHSKSEHGASRWGKIIYQIKDKKIYLILLLLVYVSMLFFHHYLHILILLSYFGLIDFFTSYIFYSPKRGLP
ncbi:MAG: CHASE2 domain-containing protein [Lentimicrobium sp.]|nr:CHASE2 domain-containing protein [Lentimicrobium sp.]